MLLHDCIRALYAATVDVHPASFPHFAMRRAGGAFECAAILWNVAAPGGIPQRRSAILDQAIDGAELAGVELRHPVGPVNGFVFHSCPVRIPGGSAEHHVVFVRPAPQRFESREADCLPQLALHMVAAEDLCRQIALRMARPAARITDEGTAIAGPDGRLREADPRFAELLSALDPGWDGRQLPFRLDSDIPVVSYKGLVVRVERRGEDYTLRVRPDRREPALTDRELEIAQRVGVGLTFKEIARELALAPSTVSTHLYNLYAKLGIRRRAELVAWLSTRAR